MTRSDLLPISGTARTGAAPSFFRRARAAAALLTLAALVAACGGDGKQPAGPAEPTPPAQPVASVQVEPGSFLLETGATRTLAARTLAANGTELTGRAVAWSSTAPQVARVDAQGTVTAVSPGQAEIRATSEGRFAVAEVTVHDPQNPPAGQDTVVASIELVGDTLVALYPSWSMQLIALPRSASGEVVPNKVLTWTTGDERTAWVSNTGGVVARRVGETRVRAEVDGKWAEVTVRVLSRVQRVEVLPASLTLAVWEADNLSARVVPLSGAPGGATVTWASEDPSIATVDAMGLVTGRALGTTMVTATSDGKEVRIPVTVAAWETRTLLGTPESGLPATLYTTKYTDDEGQEHTLRVVATAGTFRTLGFSRWEETLTVEIYEDGTLVGRQTHTDRGTATRMGSWNFVSTEQEGREFVGWLISGNRLQLEMMLEDGVPPVRMVYSAP